MVDTIVLLSFCYAPTFSRQFILVEGGFLLSCPLTMPHHVKPTMVNGKWQTFGGFWLSGFWFRSFQFGGIQFGVFQFCGFLVWLFRLMVSGFVVAGSMVLQQLVVQLLAWWLVGLSAVGFEALGSAASSLIQAALGIPSQSCWTHQCHQDRRMQCCQTQCGKAMGLYGVISSRCDNIPILGTN